jgi:hypothetical protein
MDINIYRIFLPVPVNLLREMTNVWGDQIISILASMYIKSERRVLAWLQWQERTTKRDQAIRLLSPWTPFHC